MIVKRTAIFCVLLCSSAFATIAHIGGTPAPVPTSGYAGSLTVSYTQQANHTLVLAVGVSAISVSLGWHLPAMPVVSDTLGDVWEVVSASPMSNVNYGSGYNSGWQVIIFYVRRSVAGHNTITISANTPSLMQMTAALDEYSGISNVYPLGSFSMNSASGTSSSSSTMTTVGALDLLYSAAFDDANNSSLAQTFTPSAGFTTRQHSTPTTNSTNMAVFDQTVSAAGGYSNTVTATSSSDGLHVALVGFSASTISSPFVQGNMSYGGGGSPSNATLSFPKATTPGNNIVVVVAGSSSVPTDTQGNTYTLTVFSGAFYIYQTTARAASDTITVAQGGNEPLNRHREESTRTLPRRCEDRPRWSCHKDCHTHRRPSPRRGGTSLGKTLRERRNYRALSPPSNRFQWESTRMLSRRGNCHHCQRCCRGCRRYRRSNQRRG